MNKYDDSYIGKRFGHLTVERVYKKRFSATGKTQSMFLCKCDCGRTKEEIASLVANGYMVSCGCNLKVKEKRNPQKDSRPELCCHPNCFNCPYPDCRWNGFLSSDKKYDIRTIYMKGARAVG